MMIQSELIARQDDYMMERAKLAPAVAVAEDRMGQLSQANYPGALQTPLGDNFLSSRAFRAMRYWASRSCGTSILAGRHA
jgi:hypothetical protein